LLRKKGRGRLFYFLGGGGRIRKKIILGWGGERLLNLTVRKGGGEKVRKERWSYFKGGKEEEDFLSGEEAKTSLGKRALFLTITKGGGEKKEKDSRGANSVTCLR